MEELGVLFQGRNGVACFARVGRPSQHKPDNANVARNTLTITKLKRFLDFYKDCQGDGSPMTNVAIIDNGIDGTLPILRGRIINGLSLVEDNQGYESAWWLPSHPHGTHMASFTHKLDPCGGLYIIKVCEGVSGIDADVVSSWQSDFHGRAWLTKQGYR